MLNLGRRASSGFGDRHNDFVRGLEGSVAGRSNNEWTCDDEQNYCYA